MEVIKKITYSIDDFELNHRPIADTIDIKKTKEGYTVKYLVYDTDACFDPRQDCDNFTKMVCFHGRYNLGDKTDYKQSDHESWDELKAAIKKDGGIFIAPLYLYDHSGITIKIGDFYECGLSQGHAHFDSGQVGFIYTTKDKLKEFGILKNKAKKQIENDVETYDMYIRGESYIIAADYFNKDKILVDDDNCGGYLCYEYALKALESEI